MDRGPEDRLRALEDREILRELTASYCFLVDDGRIDELVDDHFTEDATCDFRSSDGSVGPLVSRGRDEIRAFFRDVVNALLADMNHTVQNHRIRLDGDAASGECYFELTARDRMAGDAVVGAGRYIDRYRRVGEAWQFEARRAEIHYIAPLSEGWVKQPFVAALSAAAGRTG